MAMEIPRMVWQGLALCFSEGGARIFPASLAAARCSRFCRPCALYCRAGVHARRGRGCSGGAGWALCSSFPRNTRRCRKAPRRARSPALHCDRKRAATRKRQPASRPDGGPMQASAPTQGRAAVRKDLAPVFRRVCGGRESATARKGICKVRCGTPPSPAATPPLTGEAFGVAAAHRKAPLQGELDAPEGAD